MFDRLESGWKASRESLTLFTKFPTFIMPFLITQLLYFLFCAAVLLKTVMFYRSAGIIQSDPRVCVGLAFLFIFANGILLALAASVVLEFIEQRESGQPMNLAKGIVTTVTTNLPALLVVGICWWLVRIAIEVLFGRRRRGERNTAEELAEKAARMAVFMVLPAIAWEGRGFGAAIQRGLGIGRKHLAEWASGYGVSWAATRLLTFILIGVPVLVYRTTHTAPATGATFYYFIAYIVFVALLIESYTNYLELLFCATLYLWHLKWERAVKEAEAAHQPLPSLQDVPQPSLLDDVAEFGIGVAA